MKREPLALGSETFGILIDGYSDTEHIPCSLILSELGAISIEAKFPYLEPLNLSDLGEALWVNKKPIPTSMQFLHSAGEVALFGVRFKGLSASLGGGRANRITCNVDLAVEGSVSIDGGDQPNFAALRQVFLYGNVVSPIGFHPLEIEPDSKEGVSRQIRIPDPRVIWQWSHGGFTHKISEIHRTVQEVGRTEITSRLEFESSGDQPADFKTLYLEQQKFVALMQIICNKQIPLGLSEALLPDATPPLFIRVHSGRVRTSVTRESAERSTKPIYKTGLLTTSMLESWYENYDQYLRAISALSSLLPRVEIDAEERMINSFIAIETIGQISLKFGFGKVRVDSVEFVRECMSLIGLDEVDFAENTEALAQAVADNYIHIKHPRLSSFPEASETFVLGMLAQGIARAALLKVTLGVNVDAKAMSEFEIASAIARKEGILIRPPVKS